MPSKRIHRRQIRWAARRKRGGYEHFLGYFHTREEAAEAEALFDNYYPPREQMFEDAAS